MQPRSLATRLIAPAAAVFLALTVAGCGHEPIHRQFQCAEHWAAEVHAAG